MPLLAGAPLLLGFYGARVLDGDGPPPPALAIGAPAPPASPPRAQLGVPRRIGSTLVASLGEHTATLTRDPELEARLERTLVEGKTPYAATVLLEAKSGRVLAMVEHSTRGAPEGFALRAERRAASVFKIVTTATLLEADVRPSARVCTHGGRTRMRPELLVEDRAHDRQCATVRDILPESLNVAAAKLALQHLDPEALRSAAARWGFNAPIDLDVELPLSASMVDVPEDPFAFANTAAGFGEVRLSALHGAMLASVVANDGEWRAPRMVKDVDGGVLPESAPVRHVVSREVARALKSMMVETVTRGTGKKAFSMSPRLAMSAGGKTGSLTDYDTGLETSWFVGFAPADAPEVVVASVVVNTALWHVRAPVVAKEALRAWSEREPSSRPGAVLARR